MSNFMAENIAREVAKGHDFDDGDLKALAGDIQHQLNEGMDMMDALYWAYDYVEKFT